MEKVGRIVERSLAKTKERKRLSYDDVISLSTETKAGRAAPSSRKNCSSCCGRTHLRVGNVPVMANDQNLGITLDLVGLKKRHRNDNGRHRLSSAFLDQVVPATLC